MSPCPILVTGSSGFLGRHVVEHLVAQKAPVVALDLTPPSDPHPDVRYVIHDIRTGITRLHELLDVKAVIHCAGVADIDECSKDPLEAVTGNVVGTIQMLEFAAQQPQVRFVLASSVYALSNKGSVYSTTKNAAERLVENFQELHPDNFTYTIARYGSLYGPHASPSNSIRKILTQATSEDTIEYWGSGLEVREYIHVRDAARLTCAILAPRFANSVLHIYGPEKLTATELLTMIREILGRDVNLVFRGKQDSHHYKTTPFSSSVNERLGQRLISDTYIDLGSGILETLEHLEQNKSAKETVVAQRVEDQ